MVNLGVATRKIFRHRSGSNSMEYSSHPDTPGSPTGSDSKDPVHAPRNTVWKTVFDVVLIFVLLCHIGYTIMLLLGRSAQPPSARHYPTTLRQQEIDNKSFVQTTSSVFGVQASNSLPPASTLQQVYPPAMPDNSTCFWRNTGECHPSGPREPKHDLPCDSPVLANQSGYCECAGGRVAGRYRCWHDVFTCREMCADQGEPDAQRRDPPPSPKLFNHPPPHLRTSEAQDVAPQPDLSQARPIASPARALPRKFSEPKATEESPLLISGFIPAMKTDPEGLLSPDCPVTHGGKLRRRRPWDKAEGMIRKLCVVGERHSGTNWLTTTLKHSFQLPVEEGYTRFKHWFQIKRRNPRFGGILRNMLAIFIVRNPYDWLKGVYREPFHASFHASLQWDRFLRTNWTLPQSMRMGTDVAAGSAQACTNEDGFLPGEVIPCLKSVSRGTHYRHTYAVYETHPDTGQVFENILAMRAAKLMNYVEAAQWAPHVEFVRYEDLLSEGGEGARRFLHELHEKYALPCRTTPLPTPVVGRSYRVRRVVSRPRGAVSQHAEALQDIDETRQDVRRRVLEYREPDSSRDVYSDSPTQAREPRNSSFTEEEDKEEEGARMAGACQGKGMEEAFKKFKGRGPVVDQRVLEHKIFYALESSEEVNRMMQSVNPLLKAQEEACWGYSVRSAEDALLDEDIHSHD